LGCVAGKALAGRKRLRCAVQGTLCNWQHLTVRGGPVEYGDFCAHMIRYSLQRRPANLSLIEAAAGRYGDIGVCA
jgi:hypothetical protein